MQRRKMTSQPSTSSPARDGASAARAERRVVLGTPGTRPDNEPGDGLEAQMQRAWINLFDAMKAAGYEKRHLVKTTVCVTEGGQLKLFRAVRDRMMRGHVAASAYLHVGALGAFGASAHLVEVEGEVVKAAT